MDAEELALWVACRQGDLEARQRLILLHERLAHSLGRQAERVFPWVDAGDLEQYVWMGLIDAVDRFDAGRGVPFEAYARYWVKARLYRNRDVRRGITPRLRGLLRRMRAAEEDWVRVHGEAPTLVELAGTLEVPVREVDQALEIQAFCFPRSIEAAQELDDDTDPDAWEAHLLAGAPLGGVGCDQGGAPEMLAALDDLAIQVDALLGRLKPSEREILILTYWEDLPDDAIRRRLFGGDSLEEADPALRQRQINRIKQARRRALARMRRFCD